jgi:ATP-dependent Lon protease
MSGLLGRWPHLPVEYGDSLNRRADELYDVDDAPLDAQGVIDCAVLPLRDVVLYPNMVTPLFVGHEPTRSAIEDAARSRETMIAVAQMDADLESPGPEDLYAVGTEIAVGRLMQLPDGTTSVLTQGRRRIQVVEFSPADRTCGRGARSTTRLSDQSAGPDAGGATCSRNAFSSTGRCQTRPMSMPSTSRIRAGWPI